MGNRKELILGIALMMPMIIASLTGCVNVGFGPGGNGGHPIRNIQLYTESVNIKKDDRNDLHVIWAETNSTTVSIYYTKFNRHGTTIINDKLLFTETMEEEEKDKPEKKRQRERPRRRGWWLKEPDLALDSANNVHAVFEVNSRLYYTKLNSYGNFIFEPVEFTKSNNRSTDADIVIDSDENVHVVWMDWRNVTPEIMYSKIDQLGHYDIQDICLSSGWAYDPSIVLDSDENIYVSWILKNGWNPIDNKSTGAGLCYVKMNKYGDTYFRKTLNIFGRSFEQYSLEMCIDSKDQLAFVWTRNQILTYYPITRGLEYIYSAKRVTENVSMQNSCSYTTYIDDLENKGNFNLRIQVTKKNIGKSVGDIYISKNGSEMEKIEEWDFRRRPYLLSFTWEIDITEYITGVGAYKIFFQKTDGRTFPEVHSLEVYSTEYDFWCKDMGMTLIPDRSYEPAIVMDRRDDIHILFYNSTFDEAQIIYLKCDYEGMVMVEPTPLTSSNATVYDPAVVIDDFGDLNIVWFDEREDENGLYYMRLTEDLEKEVVDVRISNDRSQRISQERELDAKISEQSPERSWWRGRRGIYLIGGVLGVLLLIALAVRIKRRKKQQGVIKKKKRKK
jgi:hypothetical protein